jgi:hypothetical protein
MVDTARVLQVLADTDASDLNLAAIDLHGDLTAAGLEIRTVALTQGRTGGLAAVLPAMAPGRRTVSAVTEVRREARWADLILFQGARAVPPGLWAVAGPPVLVHLVGAPAPARLLGALSRRRQVRVVVPADISVPRRGVTGRVGVIAMEPELGRAARAARWERLIRDATA